MSSLRESLTERETVRQVEGAAMSVASLRRSSSHHTPTRTLHLSEQEHSSNNANSNNSPLRVLEVLLTNSDRPRSNQRTRTPMRHESPAHPDELRAVSPEPTAATVRRRAVSPLINTASGRITIRPLAGSAVGTVLATTMERSNSSTTPKSRKQGPSHRKIRRWNNDHFDRLASEMARGGYVAAAEVLIRAKEDAHLYREVFDPKDHTSKQMREFMEKDEFQGIRHRFFEGELPANRDAAEAEASRRKKSCRPMTASDMMNRIDGRLRRVVVKSCNNSFPAASVVETFESFIVDTYTDVTTSQNKSILKEGWWRSLLLEQPTVTYRNDGKIVVQFFFEAPSDSTAGAVDRKKDADDAAAINAAKGGFHRILLHAVCQFHGLRAVSNIIEITPANNNTTKQSRALTVIGVSGMEVKYRLLETIVPISQNKVSDGSEEKWDLCSEHSWTVI